jgi:serine/threonine-protein kinase
MDSSIGQQLGKYLIQAEIGRGGMGIVYRGYDPALQRDVAIKVLPPQLTLDREFVQRFHQEAVMAASLHHPNIIAIYDVGEQDGIHYIVMEHLAGVSLDRWIVEQGAISLAQADNVIYQICHALDYAHGRRMVHRDIKPSNIMIGPEEHATLMDFGLARAGEDSGLTRSGVVVGTAEYMAPEHALGQKIDGRSDVYSFGVVIYKMLTGAVPFARSSSYAISYAHIYEPPPPLREKRPDLSSAVEAVVLKALAKDPGDRYQKAGHLARDFSAAMAGEMPADLERWLAPAVRSPAPPSRPTAPISADSTPDGAVTQPMVRPQRHQSASALEPVVQASTPAIGGVGAASAGISTASADATQPLVRLPKARVPATAGGSRQAPAASRRRIAAPLLGALAVILLAGITCLVLAFSRPQNGGTPRGGSNPSETPSAEVTLLPAQNSPSPVRPAGVRSQTPRPGETIEANATLTPTVTLVPTVTPTTTATGTLTPRPTATRSVTSVATMTPTMTGTARPTETLTPESGERPLSTPVTPPTARPTTPPTAPPTTPPTARPTTPPTAPPTTPPTARPTTPPTVPPTTPPTVRPTTPPTAPPTTPPTTTPAPPPTATPRVKPTFISPGSPAAEPDSVGHGRTVLTSRSDALASCAALQCGAHAAEEGATRRASAPGVAGQINTLSAVSWARAAWQLWLDLNSNPIQ